MKIDKFSSPSLTMTSRDIAELTEKRHDNVKRTIETLVEKSVISQPQIEGGPKAANGVIEKHYLLGKRDSYVIVAQLSPEFTARLVDRWQELEDRLVKPPALAMTPLEVLARDVQAIADFLRVDGTSRNAMLQTMLKTEAPRYLPLVPAYSTNAPRTADGKLLGGEGNSQAAYAATNLLKKLNSKMTIHAFNKAAELHGYLETCERPSTKHLNLQRTYKAVSAKGREFGYNLSHDNSKGAVQPVWFEQKFPELLERLR